MRRIPLLTALMLFILASGRAYANEPVEMVSAFFKSIMDDKVSEAYDNLFKGSPLPAMKPQALESLKRQTNANLPMYGEILGVESLREEKLGSFIMRLVYVMKLEKHPVVWEFHFYKPKDEWYLSNISLNDEFKKIQRLE